MDAPDERPTPDAHPPGSDPEAPRGVLGWIRGWGARTELVVILLVAFTYPVGVSTAAVVFDWPEPAYTDDELLSLVGWELGVLALVGVLLRARGWALRDLGLEFSWKQTAGGVGLYFAVHATWVLLFSGFTLLPPLAAAALAAGALADGTVEAASTWPVILLVSVVNPFYEELLVVGYLVRAFERCGLRRAFAASVLLRVLYHTYQGPVGVLGSAIVGLLLGGAYLRWRKTWPLVVAHGLMDFVPLMAAANA